MVVGAVVVVVVVGVVVVVVVVGVFFPRPLVLVSAATTLLVESSAVGLAPNVSVPVLASPAPHALSAKTAVTNKPPTHPLVCLTVPIMIVYPFWLKGGFYRDLK